MRTVTKTYNICSFKELSTEAQNKAINDYIQFLIEIVDFEELKTNDNFYKAYCECKKNRTPWFLGQYIWDYCQEEIKKEIEQYEYYEDGSFFTN